MHNKPVPAAALTTAPGACTLESELLNSERIGERFGSYGIDVIEPGPTVRRSSLFSVENGQRVCRTYAVVQFQDQGSSEVANAHEAIMGGESIGATFKVLGWTISKETLHVGTMTAPAGEHSITRLMHLGNSIDLGMHVYRLILEKGTQLIHYATIVETHHSDYLTSADLMQLYGWDETSKLDAATVDTVIQLVLEQC